MNASCTAPQASVEASAPSSQTSFLNSPPHGPAPSVYLLFSTNTSPTSAFSVAPVPQLSDPSDVEPDHPPPVSLPEQGQPSQADANSAASNGKGGRPLTANAGLFAPPGVFSTVITAVAGTPFQTTPWEGTEGLGTRNHTMNRYERRRLPSVSRIDFADREAARCALAGRNAFSDPSNEAKLTMPPR